MIPKIYECLANDSLRPIMEYALITKSEVAASDAHILVIHQTNELFPLEFVQTIPEEGLLFGRSLLIDLSKQSAIDIKIVKIEGGQDLIRVTHRPKRHPYYNTYHEFKLNNGEGDFMTKYPDYEKVIPKGKPEPLTEVGLKPSLLHRLMKAMAAPHDTNNMKLTFTGIGQAILCKPLYDEYTGCRGLIMPVLQS